MANIFLSYDRDDEVRARPIAKQLELAGHSVWWDRQIKGGGEFSAEIEAALTQADKVVVLWSERAVKSAWVRDEAAVGRDTGRLVPATIDGTPAPLGFRQFQTIDLSRWKGRGSSPELRQLLDTLAPGSSARATTRPADAKEGRTIPRAAVISIAAILVVLAVVLAIRFWPRSAVGPPTIAVVAADNSEQAQKFAHDVSVRLNDLPGSDSGNFRLVEAGAGPSSSTDLTLKADSENDGPTKRRELTLISRRDGTMLWSASLEQQAGQSGDLVQQAAVGAERALSCAGEAMMYRREPIDAQTVKKYLAACTRFDDAYGSNTFDPAIAKAFEDVIAKAPHFEPALAKLLVIKIDAAPLVDDTPGMRRQLRQHVQQARALGIDIGEMYAAEAAALSPGDFLGKAHAFDEGVKRHPDNAVLYRLRGENWTYVGRMRDAVADSGRAVQIDPLSSANLQTFASLLAYSGDTDAGYAQLRKAEQLWPSAPTVINARYRMDLRYGDPKEALALLRQSVAQGGIRQGAFLRARIDPTPANIEAAISEERRTNAQFPVFIASLVQALGYFGRKDEALNLLLNYRGGQLIGYNAEVLFRPAMRDVWRDPRSIAAAAHLGLLHYWKVSGNWPDFCFDQTLPYDCKKEAAKYPV